MMKMFCTRGFCKMKKITVVLVSVFLFSFCGYSKELEGKSLQAVNFVLESNLGVSEYETLEEKLNYLDKTENQVEKYGDEISDEAKFICKSILRMQKETTKSEELLKQEKDQNNKAKKEENPETKALILGWFAEYQEFDKTHQDLSSHFYFHYKEAEFATLPYLSMGKQLDILKNIIGDYKKIEEMNPNYGENLFTYGMSLYMAPKIAGGNKKSGIEKIYKATQVSDTIYEKVSALLVYSQIMFEEKKFEESKKYLMEAETLSTAKIKYAEIREMNDAGYSIFDAEEYRKKNAKK